MVELHDLEARVGKTLYPAQAAAVLACQGAPENKLRHCLYFPTGKGKTITSLLCLAIRGAREVLVIAPPITHTDWRKAAELLDITVEMVSAAKFRMDMFKVSRSKPVIVDEFHELGGHQRKGWRKFSTIARHLPQDIVIMSATPSYNDVDRVYCVQNILEPNETKGGYLQFLHRHCETAHNPFSQVPDVIGFHRYKDASEFLQDLDGVSYVPDELDLEIQERTFRYEMPDLYVELGFDERAGFIVASVIGDKHNRINYALIDDEGLLREEMFRLVLAEIQSTSKPVLVFASHSSVAEATAKRFLHAMPTALLTGKTPKKTKDRIVSEFIEGRYKLLVGTATLATGLDGLDKVCDKLIIVDDIDGDDAKRRQLIGRIAPRGTFDQSDLEAKEVVRFNLVSPS